MRPVNNNQSPSPSQSPQRSENDSGENRAEAEANNIISEDFNNSTLANASPPPYSPRRKKWWLNPGLLALLIGTSYWGSSQIKSSTDPVVPVYSTLTPHAQAEEILNKGILVKDQSSFNKLILTLEQSQISWIKHPSRIESKWLKFHPDFKLDPESPRTARLFKTLAKRDFLDEIQGIKKLAPLVKDYNFCIKFLKANPDFADSFHVWHNATDFLETVDSLTTEELKKALSHNNQQRIKSIISDLKTIYANFAKKTNNHSCRTNSSIVSFCTREISIALESNDQEKLKTISTIIKALNLYDSYSFRDKMEPLFHAAINRAINKPNKKNTDSLKFFEELKQRTSNNFTDKLRSLASKTIEGSEDSKTVEETAEALQIALKSGLNQDADFWVKAASYTDPQALKILDFSQVATGLRENGFFIGRLIKAAKSDLVLYKIIDEFILKNDLGKIKDDHYIAEALVQHSSTLLRLAGWSSKYEELLRLTIMRAPQLLSKYPQLKEDKDFIIQASVVNPDIVQYIDSTYLKNESFLRQVVETYYRQKHRYSPGNINHLIDKINDPKLKSRIKAKAYWEDRINLSSRVIKKDNSASMDSSKLSSHIYLIKKSDILELINGSSLEEILKIHQELSTANKSSNQNLQTPALAKILSGAFIRSGFISWLSIHRYDDDIMTALKNSDLRQVIISDYLDQDASFNKYLEADTKSRYSQQLREAKNEHLALTHSAFYWFCPYTYIYLKMFDNLEDLKNSKYQAIPGLPPALQNQLKARAQKAKQTVMEQINKRPWDLFVRYGNKIKAYLPPELFQEGPQKKEFDAKVREILKTIYDFQLKHPNLEEQDSRNENVFTSRPLFRVLLSAGAGLGDYLPEGVDIKSLLEIRAPKGKRETLIRQGRFQFIRKLAFIAVISPDLVNYFPQEFQTKTAKTKIEKCIQSMKRSNNRRYFYRHKINFRDL